MNKDTLQLKLIGGINKNESRKDRIAKFLANPYESNSRVLWTNAVKALLSFNNDCQSTNSPYYAVCQTICCLPDGTVWYNSLVTNNTYENFVNKTISENQYDYSSFKESLDSPIGFGYQLLKTSPLWKNYDSTEEQVVMRFNSGKYILGNIILKYILPAYDFKLVDKTNTYDYIIIGSGASGSIIASRLAENKNIKILLLELGQNNRYNSSIISNYDKELMTVPILDGIYLSRYHQDPYKPKSNNLEESPTLLDYTTTKQKERFYGYPRGSGAGGSTNHHSMYDGRGSPIVYDNIAKLVNDPIWEYKNILNYYKKMETYNVPYSNPEIHGYNGWLKIRKNGKLNTDLKLEMIQNLSDNFNIPYSQDPAEPSQVSGVYVSEEQVNKKGVRSNSFIDLLEPTMRKNRNILLMFNSLVKNIILENDNNELNAKGVVVYHKPYVTYGNITGNRVYNNNKNAKLPNKDLPIETKYFARKEVIICSGAINTPQLLMLSGIGPKEELNKIGIQTILDRKGVGKNLLDHAFCTSIYEMDPKKILWQWQATEMKNNTDYSAADPIIKANIEKYYDPASSTNNAMGLGYTFPTGIYPSNLAEPDVHVQIANRFFFDSSLNFKKFPIGDDYQQLQHDKDSYLPDRNDPIDYNKGIPGEKPKYINSQIDPLNTRTFLSYLPELIYIEGMKQYGSITLKNSDPREQPIIDIGYYKNEDGLNRLATTILRLREYMHTPEMLKYAKDPENYEIYPGKICDTKESIIEYLKNWQLYGYHIAGTAKMGLKDDPYAVVDSRLNVLGVKNLRVCDASVYPRPYLHNYNISRGVYLIAEVISDIIKKDNE